MPASSLPPKFAFLDPPLEAEDLGSLGPYRVIGELGRGGMGFVFRAEDTRLKRVVALKVMNQKIAATADSRQRFIDEARAMAAVKHDNVATIYEVNDQSATPFMAMELLTGKTLEQVLRREKRLPYQRVIGFAKQICRGLAAAHARGIVHRDIKPANIWIDEELDRIKILDFGLALANVAVDQLTGRGSVVGTPQYLSPEQASSEPLDDRSDLFSLGVVLFELTTGQLPFKARMVADQLIATLALTPPTAREVCDEVPEPLSSLIAQLMQKEPRKRPRSARDLEIELERVAKECDAKSDVALTINKLQESLLQVASKKETPPLSLPPVVTPSLVDAFEFPTSPVPNAGGLAASPNAALSTASALGVPVSASSARPITGFGAAAANPMARKKNAGAGSDFNWAKLWPVAAIGGVAIVLAAIVGGIWYGTLSATQQNAKNLIVVPPAPAAPSPPASTPKPIQPAAKAPKPPADTNKSPAPAPEKSTNQAVASTPVPSEAGKMKDAVQEQPASEKRQDDIAPNADAVASNDRDTDMSLRAGPSSDALARNEVASSPAVDPVALTDGQSTSEAAANVDSVDGPDSTELKPRNQTTTDHVALNTNEGRGADTTVKRGSSSQDRLGEEKVLAIQLRKAGDKTVDIQHAYLRFDLKDRLDKSKKVIGCTLVLTASSSSVPADAVIRVYGVPEKYPDNWRESGTGMINWNNSLSKEDLADAPLVAEVPMQLDSENRVNLSDSRMAEFVSGLQKDDVVTFVVAGGSSEGRPIYFVSREGAREAVPELQLEVVANK